MAARQPLSVGAHVPQAPGRRASQLSGGLMAVRGVGALPTGRAGMRLALHACPPRLPARMPLTAEGQGRPGCMPWVLFERGCLSGLGRCAWLPARLSLQKPVHGARLLGRWASRCSKRWQSVAAGRPSACGVCGSLLSDQVCMCERGSVRGCCSALRSTCVLSSKYTVCGPVHVLPVSWHPWCGRRRCESDNEGAMECACCCLTASLA